MTLPGRSRTIVVEPLRRSVPERQPARRPREDAPAPRRRPTRRREPSRR